MASIRGWGGSLILRVWRNSRRSARRVKRWGSGSAMLAYPLARLAHLPHDPLIEPRAWRLVCGASCGCREELGRALVYDATAHLWTIWLDDHYQPNTPARDSWARIARIRRAKKQPWATGSGVNPAPAIPDGARQPVAVVDMRQGGKGHLQPVGHQIGPLGVGRTPGNILITCRHGHVSCVTSEHIESEVRRLADLSPALN